MSSIPEEIMNGEFKKTFFFHLYKDKIDLLNELNDLIIGVKAGDYKPELVDLEFKRCENIDPDMLFLFVLFMRHLSNLGILIKGSCYCYKQDNFKYLTENNFFQSISANFKERTNDEGSTGQMLRIQPFQSDIKQLEIVNGIIRILSLNTAINKSVLTGLDYCLQEVTDNILNHSEQEEGWVYAEYFKATSQVRIIVGDYGIGVHESLTSCVEHENNDEETSMLDCFVSGVTNGKGQGHGLYATSKFVELNKGNLSLISGNKMVEIVKDNKKIKDIPFWQGTCLFININANIDVKFEEFTGEGYGNVVDERLDDWFN